MSYPGDVRDGYRKGLVATGRADEGVHHAAVEQHGVVRIDQREDAGAMKFERCPKPVRPGGGPHGLQLGDGDVNRECRFDELARRETGGVPIRAKGVVYYAVRYVAADRAAGLDHGRQQLHEIRLDDTLSADQRRTNHFHLGETEKETAAVAGRRCEADPSDSGDGRKEQRRIPIGQRQFNVAAVVQLGAIGGSQLEDPRRGLVVNEHTPIAQNLHLRDCDVLRKDDLEEWARVERVPRRGGILIDGALRTSAARTAGGEEAARRNSDAWHPRGEIHVLGTHEVVGLQCVGRVGERAVATERDTAIGWWRQHPGGQRVAVEIGVVAKDTGRVHAQRFVDSHIVGIGRRDWRMVRLRGHLNGECLVREQPALILNAYVDGQRPTLCVRGCPLDDTRRGIDRHSGRSGAQPER